MERENDRSLASPGVVAWRTRHLVGVMLGAGVGLVGLTLVASQAALLGVMVLTAVIHRLLLGVCQAAAGKEKHTR